jgi:hypothetical protein
VGVFVLLLLLAVVVHISYPLSPPLKSMFRMYLTRAARTFCVVDPFFRPRIDQTCTGPSVPTTTVKFPATASQCKKTKLEAVKHILQLGLDCSGGGGGGGSATTTTTAEEDDDRFFFHDLYVECHEGADFASLDGTGDIGARYSCGQSQIFLDDTSDTAQTVAAFSITTDTLWLKNPDSLCYTSGPAVVVGTTPTAPAAAAATFAPASAPTTATTTGTTTTTTANYKVEYTAQFQHQRDSSCVGGPPELRVMCTGDIRFVNASQPAITCQSLPTSLALVSHPNGLQCTIDCEANGDCSGYIVPFFNVFRLESVIYECSGDVFGDVSSIMQVTQGAGLTYTCPSDDTEPAQAHFGRMGVTCGGPTTSGQQRAASFDSVLFECVLGTGFTFNENFLDIGDELACGIIDGCSINDDCDCASGLACRIDLGELGVMADIYNFPADCVETAAGLTLPAAPSPPPVDPSSVSGGGEVMTARFRASWSLFADDAASATNCAVDSTIAIVECFQSNISLLETAASVTCSPASDSLLRCVDSGATFRGGFASFVEYVRCTLHVFFHF